MPNVFLASKSPRTFLCFSIVIILSYRPAFGQNDGHKPWIDSSFLINLNGVDQYVEIRGEVRSNPILLFIHGGPSWPATPMIRKYNQDLIKDFVLVSWDQRNCGKSKTDTSKLTPSLYVADAHQLTLNLKKMFHAEKIFIVCHSWGTVVGIQLVTSYPEDYFAYIGVGQVVSPESILIARDHALAEALRNHDTTTLEIIRGIQISKETMFETPFENVMKLYTVAAKYFQHTAVQTLSDPTQLYPDYHYNVMDWFTPVFTSGKELFLYMNSIKLDMSSYNSFETPMYFFSGRYDYNTPVILVEKYVQSITAPMKKLYLFEQSGHSPCWEEPATFRDRIYEIAKEIVSD